MTKPEILMEIQELGNPDTSCYDINQFIIIGEAAEVVNTDSDHPNLQEIEVWVNPGYYDVILMGSDLIETKYDENGKPTQYIGYAFAYINSSGTIKLYRGDVIGTKPKYKKIDGCNVQVLIQEASTARILNFHRKNDNLGENRWA